MNLNLNFIPPEVKAPYPLRPLNMRDHHCEFQRCASTCVVGVESFCGHWMHLDCVHQLYRDVGKTSTIPCPAPNCMAPATLPTNSQHEYPTRLEPPPFGVTHTYGYNKYIDSTCEPEISYYSTCDNCSMVAHTEELKAGFSVYTESKDYHPNQDIAQFEPYQC